MKKHSQVCSASMASLRRRSSRCASTQSRSKPSRTAHVTSFHLRQTALAHIAATLLPLHAVSSNDIAPALEHQLYHDVRAELSMRVARLATTCRRRRACAVVGSSLSRVVERIDEELKQQERPLANTLIFELPIQSPFIERTLKGTLRLHPSPPSILFPIAVGVERVGEALGLLLR